MLVLLNYLIKNLLALGFFVVWDCHCEFGGSSFKLSKKKIANSFPWCSFRNYVTAKRLYSQKQKPLILLQFSMRDNTVPILLCFASDSIHAMFRFRVEKCHASFVFFLGSFRFAWSGGLNRKFLVILVFEFDSTFYLSWTTTTTAGSPSKAFFFLCRQSKTHLVFGMVNSK